MTPYFYALWIPQCQEGIPNVRESKLPLTDLRDRKVDPHLYVEGKIDADTRLITLEYELEGSPRRTLSFQMTDMNNKGFIVYKLELEDEEEEDFLRQDLRCGMPKAIYHYIKGFFHKHKYHNPDDDSLLDSYFSLTSIDLKNKKVLRQIIKVYLGSYVNKYTGCINLCRQTLEKVSAYKEQDIMQSISHEILFNVINNNKGVIDGESMYCDFIIQSCPELVNAVQVQRIADLRIELELYDERLQRFDASLSSELGLKLGRLGIIITLATTLCSFGLSLLLSKCSSTELQDNVNVIREDVRIMQQRDSTNSTDIEAIKQRQDSIIKLLKATSLPVPKTQKRATPAK